MIGQQRRMHSCHGFRQRRPALKGALAITMLLGSMLGCGLEEVGEGGDDDAIPAAVQQALDESCATSSGCHAAGSSLLVLAAPESSAILSASGNGMPLVSFGDLENSYLAQKILGGSSIAGGQMPPSPQSDDDDVNAAIIIGWIAGVPLDDEDGGDGDGDPTGDGDGDPTCFVGTPLPTDPTFGTDIWPVLENRCAIMGCHANLSVPLMPDEATSYMNLIGMPAATAQVNYVEPGDPDGSYLWHKLAGTASSVEGGGGLLMPVGGQLCGTEFQAIYAWILDGAAE
ncbi:MAG TPA: hypothetical protein VK034_05825 [Enhygromyxa sp.]|nr:hypothetical protein [Enhygromyxa sp.]